MVKVDVVYPRTVEGEKTETYLLSRVPCVDEVFADPDGEGFRVRSVIHFASPKRNQPVAEIRL